MNITQLVKKAQQRDADAFTQLMEGQMQNMYKAARSILRSEDDVADAVSETMLICWEKLGTLKKPRFFRTWMTRILINKCNDILREGSRTILTDEPPEVEFLEQEFLNLEWKEALNVLDEKYRTVMILYYAEGFSLKEIALILDIPESTARTRLARGRKQYMEADLSSCSGPPAGKPAQYVQTPVREPARCVQTPPGRPSPETTTKKFAPAMKEVWK